MAEAEDVLTDAARHATEYAQALWQRHRGAGAQPQALRLADVARRIDLLVTAAFGRSYPLRVAQAPAAPTLLARWMRRDGLPHQPRALPATDGTSLWLPGDFGAEVPHPEALARFRLHALRQAMRAHRRVRSSVDPAGEPASLHAVLLLLEARAADDELLRRLPALAPALQRLRNEALAQRPAVHNLAPALQPLERLARAVLQAGEADAQGTFGGVELATLLRLPASPDQALAQAVRLHDAWRPSGRKSKGGWLWQDSWTGSWRAPEAGISVGRAAADADDGGTAHQVPRSARLARRPEVREAVDDEDDERSGAWMVQTAQPNEAAEDPMGMQRPTDRDASTAADEFADAVSELREARLVATPGKPKEVLLSDDPPGQRGRQQAPAPGAAGARLHYPEWDWQAGAYRLPGTTVHVHPAHEGPVEEVQRILEQRAAMLQEIRRRFELLRARRQRLRRQLDGESVDLDAWCEAQADFRAGLPMPQRLYATERRARRDLAITLLVDISGSTDAWVDANRRIVDVEREALLMVCIALEGMADPYEVLAFSGEGPHGVIVREIKRFGERYGPEVARRIAGLEPEHYTRCGAAVRHATASLMRQAASHRLLLLLSDGKPNDLDAYEGRYGVEDTRQAVTEARLQGISPFCLTIDRQAAAYLPAMFGPHQFALLQRPELLPSVLLDWLRRLVTG